MADPIDGLLGAFALGDYPTLSDLLGELIERARRSGALVHLSPAYHYRALHALAVTSLDAASRIGRTKRRCSRQEHRHDAERWQPVVLAWRGSEREFRTVAAQLKTHCERRGLGRLLNQLSWATMLLELGLSNYDAAAAAVPTRLHRRLLHGRVDRK